MGCKVSLKAAWIPAQLGFSENLSEKNQGMNMSKIDYQLHDMLQNFEVHMGNA